MPPLLFVYNVVVLVVTAYLAVHDHPWFALFVLCSLASYRSED